MSSISSRRRSSNEISSSSRFQTGIRCLPSITAAIAQGAATATTTIATTTIATNTSTKNATSTVLLLIPFQLLLQLV